MGYEIDPPFEKKLEALPPFIQSTYCGGGSYLEKISYEGKQFLGKKVPILPKLEELFNLQKNIQSLLSNLIPEYPIRANQIVIFSYYDNTTS